MPELLDHSPPMGLLLDLEAVNRLLRQTALCMAMNLSTDLKEVDISNGVLRKFVNASRVLQAITLEFWEDSGERPIIATQVTSNGQRMLSKADEFHDLFCRNFLRFAV